MSSPPHPGATLVTGSDTEGCPREPSKDSSGRYFPVVRVEPRPYLAVITADCCVRTLPPWIRGSRYPHLVKTGENTIIGGLEPGSIVIVKGFMPNPCVTLTGWSLVVTSEGIHGWIASSTLSLADPDDLTL